MADKTPSGRKHGVFLISIDDGYVEYSYTMHAGKDLSIANVHEKIARALNCKRTDGTMRSRHWKQHLTKSK